MSCGCAGWKKHDHRQVGQHPLYALWRGMRARCLNPNHKGYPDYGGRGIKVCERWDNFAAFVEDMGEKPGPEYTLDRIDNDGDYEPGNTRWATWEEQHANKRVRRGGRRS